MYVVTGGEMHQIDRYTMEQIGLSEEMLMENAGQVFKEKLLSLIQANEKIIVFIGAGNNGGDGFVISRLLLERGCDVKVWVIPSENRIRGTACKHKDIYKKCGYSFQHWQGKEGLAEKDLSKATLVVDALLGTGIEGPLKEPYGEVISLINSAKKRVISVDIPSGIPNGGDEESRGILASETYTLQAPKLSAFTFPSAENYGQLHVLDIGIPSRSFQKAGIKRELITAHTVKDTLPVREMNSHKGKAGKALVIAGSESMPGAAVLTANACLRAGAGLLSLAIPQSIQTIVASQSTESTFIVLENTKGSISPNAFSDAISFNNFHGVAIGPGLGRANSYPLFKTLQPYSGLVVIDADGLYHLSQELPLWRSEQRQGATIITPHPGEMAMLTALSVAEVEQNRFEVSKSFAKTYQMYVVLKGPYTIITTPEGHQYVNTTGNASLAKGGSGDVLTGIILGFLLQHKSIQDALCNAVYVHGITADRLMENLDTFSVVATDLIDTLPIVLRSARY
ncbi:bifunctional ADP-dependent NAD(P)H-hydrate dehydratase/NAD(P)H-hydrate epimerase [Salipaludibacillus neizhouensis]|uniref:Bifunctional NAD(P)H-hydrate repair enzyme n=1 Tax=Salipaludibacillus neizhouensis TaxID=885475 RepID=A0A3A9JW14_9BACI|nr:NAD(P)H-hydrate dehydratase [Salipaludibacillus neizhouensis]RKL65104.1 bifunctional ADP-dependent NAD(P)H-hydrate dehydratase/NAD(P)H-hydrate epimerase [Salipaludibacillus neizhouensis]